MRFILHRSKRVDDVRAPVCTPDVNPFLALHTRPAPPGPDLTPARRQPSCPDETRFPCPVVRKTVGAPRGDFRFDALHRSFSKKPRAHFGGGGG